MVILGEAKDLALAKGVLRGWREVLRCAQDGSLR
jgi:hypothetical protein